MESLEFKLVLISQREVLGNAIRSLLHLATGRESPLVRFSRLEHALEQSHHLESADILLLEITTDLPNRLQRLEERDFQGSIIALTESANHELGLSSIRSGAHDYVILDELSPGSLFRVLRFAVERRKAQQAIESGQAQLSQAQKMEAIGRMASGLAHDFRQYIQVIVGNSKVLQRLTKGDETVDQLVKDIADAGYGASELVGQVLDFARQGPVEMRELELNRAVAAKRAMVESFGKKVRVSFDLSPYPIQIEGDDTQVGQIVLNLAINAVDACAGKGKVEVRTRLLSLGRRYSDRSISIEPGHYALLEVMDTGSGIPEEVMESIFDPFFTTKPRGEGTGLGLSTVYTLAHAMDGTLAIWTHLNKGTTFSVLLPCKSKLSQPQPQPVEMNVGLLSTNTLERSLLRHDLKSLGCRVTEFSLLSEALEWSNKHPDNTLFIEHELAPDLAELKSNHVLVSGLLIPDSPVKILQRPYSLGEVASACEPEEVQAAKPPHAHSQTS